jgi:mycoredoxin
MVSSREGEKSMATSVTVYSTPWCGYCRIAKRFLDEHTVPYTEIDIEADEDAALRVEQWNHGNRTVPTIDIDGTILTNPSPAQLRQVLGL